MDSLVESAGIITRFNFSEVGNTKQIKFDDFLGLMVFAIEIMVILTDLSDTILHILLKLLLSTSLFRLSSLR